MALVDFRRTFEVTIERLQELSMSNPPWLRMVTPYREHMAQQLARKIMRVGLEDDERPDWDVIAASLGEPGTPTGTASETSPSAQI